MVSKWRRQYSWEPNPNAADEAVNEPKRLPRNIGYQLSDVSAAPRCDDRWSSDHDKILVVNRGPAI